jgi:hypothetical protein
MCRYKCMSSLQLWKNIIYSVKFFRQKNLKLKEFDKFSKCFNLKATVMHYLGLPNLVTATNFMMNLVTATNFMMHDVSDFIANIIPN